EWIECWDAVFVDLDLLVALVQGCSALLIFRERRFQARFRHLQLRACLLDGLAARRLQRLRLINLIHSDELLGQKGLNASEIAACVVKVLLGSGESSSCIENRGLCL